MGSHLWSVVLLALSLMMVSRTMGAAPRKLVDVPFGRNYAPTRAFNHIKYFNRGFEIQLSLDKYTDYEIGREGRRRLVEVDDLAALAAAKACIIVDTSFDICQR